MSKLNITGICVSAVAKHQPEAHDWGNSFLVDEELEAFRIAYAYRNSPHGVKVEHCPNVGKFQVTVWNSEARGLGCDV